MVNVELQGKTLGGGYKVDWKVRDERKENS